MQHRARHLSHTAAVAALLATTLGGAVAGAHSPVPAAHLAATSTGDPFTDTDYDTARAAAAAAGKVILLDFFTTWCGPCKKMDETTWTDPEVRSWLGAHAIAIKIDGDKHKTETKRWRVKAYPTILLVRADGTELDRMTGYRPASAFLDDVTAALDGRDAVARAREKLEGAGAKDSSARMDYARALAERGDHVTALTEYLRAFDEGAADHGFAGVRLSFLLSAIERLGRDHPPALEALRERRDAAAARVLGPDRPDGGSRKGRVAIMAAVAEMTALDRTLKDDPHTLTVYDALRARGGGESRLRAEAMHHAVLELLLDHGRYADALAGADLAVLTARELEMTTRLEEALAKRHRPLGPDVLGRMKERSAERLARYYEALVGVGRKDEAVALAARILELSESAKTLATLAKAASRAGATEEAAAWRARVPASPSRDDEPSPRVRERPRHREPRPD